MKPLFPSIACPHCKKPLRPHTLDADFCEFCGADLASTFDSLSRTLFWQTRRAEGQTDSKIQAEWDKMMKKAFGKHVPDWAK